MLVIVALERQNDCSEFETSLRSRVRVSKNFPLHVFSFGLLFSSNCFTRLWRWKGHLEVFPHASKSNSLWMRSDDSYNYSELCSNTVAWQPSFLGPIVYSWESIPTPTGISRLGVPGGGGDWLPTVLSGLGFS